MAMSNQGIHPQKKAAKCSMNIIGRVHRLLGHYNLIIMNNETMRLSGMVVQDAPTSDNAVKVSATLRKKLLTLKATFVDSAGKQVDYRELKRSFAFEDLMAVARSLKRIDPTKLSVQQRKAFFINTYHALSLHALTHHGKRKGGFFSKMAYDIGGLLYSLDDIEHGVLRGNKHHPITHRLCFLHGDPRLQCVVPIDPRIHLALNCGAMSCPNIHVYSDNLEADIAQAAKSFLEGDVVVDVDRGTVHVSKIFKWYRCDFTVGDNLKPSVVEWIKLNGPQIVTDKIASIQGQGRCVRVQYSKYDWRLNSTGLKGDQNAALSR
eukprot:m.19631 g.19631  ORF g.19631 m.19631 type:complete len:320 (+) comp11907_c0_seq1:498-1457(+)